MRLFIALFLFAFLAPPQAFPEDKPVPVAQTPTEWHGVLGCAKCDHKNSDECLPSIKTDTLFLLKPGLSAPPAIKDFLERVQNGEMKGEFLLKGELSESNGKKWIAVASMIAKPLPEKGSESLTYARKKPTNGTNSTTPSKGSVTGTDQGGGGGGGGRSGRGRRHGADQTDPIDGQ